MGKWVNHSDCADRNWHVWKDDDGYTPDSVNRALLMDIRSELRLIARRLSALECPNFVAIPGTLRDIRKNTTKSKRKRASRRARS